MDITKYTNGVPNNAESARLNSDVYFLIQRFLSSGALTRTLQTLNEELEEFKVLPKRIDWLGNEHDRSVEDMENQYSNIRQDFLYYLCHQASLHLNPKNASISSFLSFRPRAKNNNNVCHNYKQFYNYVTRIRGAPIQELKTPFNIINSIRGRETAGPFSRHRAITPRLYSGIQNQRITLGHLSAVYCLLFDHSGRYIITGADDLLIKLWSTYTGRLIAAFRGASSEITDIAIDSENSLLAAGSIDRILRVWNLQNGVPIAVLTGHTGMITSINFCPTPCWGLRYLISTSTDGSIAFWTYNYDGVGKAEFRNTPILYQEKIRPGQAQMICSSFSPGGTFLATGSADHNVRVYYMKGDEGPQRILETEAHTDRVDSIQWAHSKLRFLSGSKDGTAIIWWFERQQWKSIHLDMMAKLPNDKQASDYDGKKIRVTMVAWDRSDSWVVTAVSDQTLKVWTASTGQLVKILTGHTDEVYVLEPHPHDEDIILSAGHDGQLFVWDINKGEILARYLNTIEGQGYGAIFDVKWSPDGCVIAASDSHGNILTFGFGSGSSFYQQLPKELFFHTDYRPLVRDQNYWVLDEQTQVPPHLMPPPFLVDIDGNPYPPMLQRWVPGRESCNVEQLVPNIVIGNEGTQEVIQDVPRILLEDSEDEDIRGSAGGSHRSQRIRQSTGNWQTDPNMEWKRNILIRPILPSVLERCQEIRKLTEDAEMNEYQKQLRQRPHMISTAGPSNVKSRDKKKKTNGLRNSKTPKNYIPMTQEDLKKYGIASDDDTESSGYSDWAEERLEKKKRPKRRQRKKSSDDDDEEDDSEEDEEEDIEEEDEDAYEEEKEDKKVKTSKESSTRSSKEKSTKPSPKASTSKQPPPKPNPVPKPVAVPSTSGVASSSKGPKIKLSEHYKLSEWLSETRPRKSPYYPQMCDELVYFIQGHQLYLDAVRLKTVYEISTKDLPWNKMQIQDHEFCKVIGIQYEIKPPRLCCLKLALQDDKGRLTGKVFTVKYHDMPDVLDFFVLKQTYLTALSRNWQHGDKFRCMIDDNWWLGEVINKSAVSETHPDSAFMCYQIIWTNGEQERMSPWDMEPMDNSRVPEDDKAALPVLEAELQSILYKPTPDDWPNCERDTACKAISKGVTQVMGLAIAEPFLVPVDINVYPTYALIVEYPIDLSTIKARFENNFYRRLTAAQFDIRYLATNAEKFNERHSIIVKHARILTELCLRIVKNGNNQINIASMYHQLVDGYDSSNTEDDVELSQPSTSRCLRALPVRAWKSPDDWKAEARTLLDLMWETEDSVPFRAPVNQIKYPTYHQVIKNAMDLGTVKEKLQNDEYQVPQEFCIDMKLIFQNSRSFNTNKRSRIYVMTVRLSAMFDEQIKKILSNWRLCKKRQRRLISGSGDSDVSMSSSSDSEVYKDLPHLDNHQTPLKESDSDSDNTPLDVLKTLSQSNTATESDNTLDKLVVEETKPGEVEENLKQHKEEFELPLAKGKTTVKEEITSAKKAGDSRKRLKSENEDLHENGPSTSSGAKKLETEQINFKIVLKRQVIKSSDDDEDYFVPERSMKGIEVADYRPPNYIKTDDLDGDFTLEEASSSSREKRTDTEYKSPSRRKEKESSDDEEFNIEDVIGVKLNKVDSCLKRKKRLSSGDEDFEIDGATRSRGKRNAIPRRRRKDSFENDGDFEVNEATSSKARNPRRRKKVSSEEEDSDSELDEGASFKGKKKDKAYRPPGRRRPSSFVVDDDDDLSLADNSESSSSEENLPRKSGLRQRPRRKKPYTQSDSDSDSEGKLQIRTKRRKVLKSDSDSNDKTSKGGQYFNSVSSRGRVRKITERAAAFLKKDKKLG